MARTEAKEIIVLQNDDPDEMTFEVNEYLDEGWKRSGPMVILATPSGVWPTVMTQVMRK